MNVVDSSGWLSYFAGDKNAGFFSTAIEDTTQLIVPVICVYEVFKRLLQQRGESAAVVSIGDMYQGQIVDVTAAQALSAAKISTDLKIPMADSLILATARAYDATLWTQDRDFEGMEGVEYVEEAPQ